MSTRYSLMSLGVVLAVLLAGLLSFALPERTYACSCIPIGSPLEELDENNSVFRGKVISATRLDDETRYEFKVTAVWKGPLTESRAITAGNSDSMCGRGYMLGEEYLVYSYDGTGDGFCSRTMRIGDASEDLAELGEGQAPRFTVDWSMVAILFGIAGLFVCVLGIGLLNWCVRRMF